MLPDTIKMLIDMTIGDGYIGYRGKNQYFEIGHAIKQAAYAHHKAEQLRTLFPDVRERTYVVKTGKNKGRGYYHVALYHHPAIAAAYKHVYNAGKKAIDRSLLRHLDETTLAYWFMDDGTAKAINYLKKGNVRYIYNECKTQEYRLATDSFPYDQQQYIVEWLYTLDIEASLTKHTKNTWNVAIRKEQAKDMFRDIVRPYIIPSMLYKIEKRHNFTDVPFYSIRE